MLPVRVFFSKTGDASYISHLDLQRSVFRAIKRSGLNAVHTEGYNPHIKAAFACPLSVYQKSEYEIFDFYVADDISYEEITSKLKEAFPAGLKVIKAAKPVLDQKEIALADYEVNLTTKLPAEEIERLLSGEIVVVKRSKKGDKPTDISPFIKEKRCVNDSSRVKVFIKCSCGVNEHLNIKYIIDFLADAITDYDITRTMLYTKDGSVFC